MSCEQKLQCFLGHFHDTVPGQNTDVDTQGRPNITKQGFYRDLSFYISIIYDQSVLKILRLIT